MKPCRDCGITAALAKGRSICKPCWNKRQYAWRTENRPQWAALKAAYRQRQRQKPEWVAQQRKRGREYWQGLRLEVMDAYGGRRCACCGELEILFLSVDHINEDGAAHRRALGYPGNGKGGGSRTMQWLKQAGFPPGFQVLCFNCNHGKHVNGGTCPHQRVATAKLTVVR